MTENTTLIPEGLYAPSIAEAEHYEALAGVPPTAASTADLDALLAEFGASHPLVGRFRPDGEQLDERAAMDSAILAGLVSP
jgi:hypothetical protein